MTLNESTTQTNAVNRCLATGLVLGLSAMPLCVIAQTVPQVPPNAESYFGVILTAGAYLFWFIVMPIARVLGSIAKSLGSVLWKLVDLLRRFVVVGVVAAGAAVGLMLIVDPSSVRGFLVPVRTLPKDLIFLNGAVMAVGLALLAVAIASWYLKTPLSGDDPGLVSGEAMDS